MSLTCTIPPLSGQQLLGSSATPSSFVITHNVSLQPHLKHHLLQNDCASPFLHRFVASANLHEGAIVANYPFDGYPDHSERLTGKRNPAPDDNAFQFLAKLYAKKHASMAASQVTELIDEAPGN
jgi:hypothetical protein